MSDKTVQKRKVEYVLVEDSDEDEDRFDLFIPPDAHQIAIEVASRTGIELKAAHLVSGYYQVLPVVIKVRRELFRVLDAFTLTELQRLETRKLVLSQETSSGHSSSNSPYKALFNETRGDFVSFSRYAYLTFCDGAVPLRCHDFEPVPPAPETPFKRGAVLALTDNKEYSLDARFEPVVQDEADGFYSQYQILTSKVGEALVLLLRNPVGDKNRHSMFYLEGAHGLRMMRAEAENEIIEILLLVFLRWTDEARILHLQICTSRSSRRMKLLSDAAVVKSQQIGCMIPTFPPLLLFQNNRGCQVMSINLDEKKGLSVSGEKSIEGRDMAISILRGRFIGALHLERDSLLCYVEDQEKFYLIQKVETGLKLQFLARCPGTVAISNVLMKPF